MLNPLRSRGLYLFFLGFWLLQLVPSSAVAEDIQPGSLSTVVASSMKGMNGVVSIQALRNNGQDKYIFMCSFYDPSKKQEDPGNYMPWRLLVFDAKNQQYEPYSEGTHVEILMSLEKANPRHKYGVPGSGLPRGAKNSDGFLRVDEVRLAANKELGDCGNVYHLHADGTNKAFDILISKATGNWIIVDYEPKEVAAEYLDRGDQAKVLGIPRQVAFGVKPEAVQPKLTDDLKPWDDYYGVDVHPPGAPNSINRFWMRDNFIVAYEADPTHPASVLLQKIDGTIFTKAEVFDRANDFSGAENWTPSAESQDESDFRSDDGKYALLWFHKGSETQFMRVALDTPDNSGNPNSPKPTVYDDPKVFEDYYGKVSVEDLGWGKVRIWRRGNFVIMHLDCRPERLLVNVSKADRMDLNEVEIFEIADRFCGKLKWTIQEQDDKHTTYQSDDKKCKLTFFRKDPADLKNVLAQSDRVSIQYELTDKTLDKL